jgi:hypothetical protein
MCGFYRRGGTSTYIFGYGGKGERCVWIYADAGIPQRQTVVSQFFQLDKLVVEGGKTGKQTGSDNDIVRQKDHG